MFVFGFVFVVFFIEFNHLKPNIFPSFRLPVNKERVIQGNLLHTLAARSLIRDLEEGSSFLHANSANPSAINVRDEVIRLGTKYGYGIIFCQLIFLMALLLTTFSLSLLGWPQSTLRSWPSRREAPRRCGLTAMPSHRVPSLSLSLLLPLPFCICRQPT